MLGYKIIDGEIVKNAEEAVKVLNIFIGYREGKALRVLAKEYGYKTSHSSIRRILQNKKYIGDEYYPKIVDKLLFDEVNNKLEETKNKLRRKNINKKEEKEVIVKYTMGKKEKIFSDPYEEASYIYSLIKEESVNGLWEE